MTAGLESMIVGEAEIQGQVKRAFEAALQAGCTGPLSNRLWSAALTAGKRVRSETGIGSSHVSVPSAAVGLAVELLGDLRERHVVILGAGETSELTARALADRGAGTIFVANRHADRARSLAQRFGGSVVGLDGLPEQLATADIVVSSTSSPHPIVGRDELAQVLDQRDGSRPLLLIDIAVPRDIDPRCGELEGVTLYDIDDLQRVVARNLDTRASEVPRAEQIVEEEIHRFAGWLGQLDALPTVSALREHGDAIVAQVLAENDGRWESASPRDLVRVEALARSIANRILHEPTIRLRSLSESPLPRLAAAGARAVRAAGGRRGGDIRGRHLRACRGQGSSSPRCTTCSGAGARARRPKKELGAAHADRHAWQRPRARAGAAGRWTAGGPSGRISHASRLPGRAGHDRDRGRLRAGRGDKSRWVQRAGARAERRGDRPRRALRQGRPRRAGRRSGAAGRAARGRQPRMCCAWRVRSPSLRTTQRCPAGLEQLAPGARVGTSSVRRAAQLRAAREDLEVVAVRGNVDTRLRKLGEGGFDALVLARAGLLRLGREAEIAAVLDPARFVPSPGQGTLALEGRADDEATRAAVQAITDAKTFACLQAERAVAHALGASCNTPLGAYAYDYGCGCLHLRAWVGLPDGSAWVGDELLGASTTPRRSAAAWRSGSSAPAPGSCCAGRRSRRSRSADTSER